MKLSFIFEGIAEKMDEFVRILTGKKSKVREKFVNPDGSLKPNARQEIEKLANSIKEYDPSEKYAPFIIKNIAGDKIILPEDGNILKLALDKYRKYSKKQNWTGLKEIMQYDSWRDLQTDVMKFLEQYPEEEASAAKNFEQQYYQKIKQNIETLVDIDLNLRKQDGSVSKTNFKAFRCLTPEATAFMGRGSGWCTTYNLMGKMSYNEFVNTSHGIVSSPSSMWKTFSDLEKFVAGYNEMTVEQLRSASDIWAPQVGYFEGALRMARNYMPDNSPMYILYRDGKPHLQMTADGSQIMNVSDHALHISGAPTAKVFLEMLPKIPKNEKIYNRLKALIKYSNLKIDGKPAADVIDTMF